ncbi:hypothetical protein HMPREF9095_1554 [Haemophilus aegyptius ATCC 11116]|nr:hypothetical protein HMPREF9095_1554 [Haemophilus aegyptius ATCC 11116]
MPEQLTKQQIIKKMKKAIFFILLTPDKPRSLEYETGFLVFSNMLKNLSIIP